MRLLTFLLFSCALFAQIPAPGGGVGGGGGSAPPSGTAGGDLAGTYPNPTVTAISAVTASEIGANLKCTDAVGTDAYACNLSPAPASLASLAGALVQIQVATANTGASSFAPNSFTAKAIKKQGGGTDTATNDIIANSTISLVYNATLDVWILQSAIATAASATPGGSDTQLQYNNAGAFGGMSGTAWVGANRTLTIKDLATDTDDLFTFTADPAGDPNNVTIFSINATGNLQPTSVASSPGTDGGYIQFTAAAGGDSTHATTANAGRGGGAGLQGGLGGNSEGVGTNNAGDGGRVVLTSGSGGAAVNGTANNGGDAGDAQVILGNGGGGSTAVGLDGKFVVRGGTRANSNLQEWQLNAGSAVVSKVSSAGRFSTLGYDTNTNCSDSAGAAACSAAPAGAVVIDAAATTVTVSTTAVTATSRIFIVEDSSLATELGITCNTTIARTYAVTARTAATSFVITTSAAPITNPACLSYFIVN